jgi:acyl-CoA reductase-like NAD-dependent aldehyde dehydrogenase
MVDAMSRSRAERAAALEKWAEEVDSADLELADTTALRTIADLAEARLELDAKITDAVRSARQRNRSWSEIGTMLGVSKQAAQRKYGSKMASG